MGYFVPGGKNGMGCFVRGNKNSMGCYVRGDKTSMGCFVRGGKSLWDVLSGVAKNGMGCFVPGCFVRLPSEMPTLANGEDPYEMPQNVAFRKGLHRLKVKTILKNIKQQIKTIQQIKTSQIKKVHFQLILESIGKEQLDFYCTNIRVYAILSL